jgi:lipopolysaccharide transport system ATP-binding protein
MSDVVIRVEGLGKQYHIGRLQKRGGYKTIRETVVDVCAAPFRRIGRLVRGHHSAADLDETMWALRDVSFEIKQGEVVGIIGSNGAGKSTLLKILSRITGPTLGYADVDGRIGSLLEVGTGFHPELTGRENIFLNGAILGMRRSEIQHKFDEIVAFSEINKFLDTPVKHYSSGMYVRLAFAVAAHLETEILMVDEVLAVGDAAFQKKCLGKMESVTKAGRTILFVSHSMGAITQLCKSAMWLDNGYLKLSGPAPEIVSSYLAEGTDDGDAFWNNPNPVAHDMEVQLKSARLLTLENETANIFNYDSDFKIEILYQVIHPIRDLSVTFHLFDSHGNFIFESMDTDLPEWRGRVLKQGEYQATCIIRSCLLKPGRYFISIDSYISNVKIIEHQERVLSFDIYEMGCTIKTRRRLGIVAPTLEWKINHMEEQY